MSARLKYLTKCALKLRDITRTFCPSCGNKTSTLIERKLFVTALRRCDACHLQFRTPTTTGEENAAFYQTAYKQGFTSDLPSDTELAKLLETKFAGQKKDAGRYLKIFETLGGKPGMKLFDFGCSWGYGSYQFKERGGYNVTSFEISKPRCQFAREKLGVDAFDSLPSAGAGTFDIFFSGHVLEHVPSVAESIRYARKMLKPGGLFVAFTPNGSHDRRPSHRASWSRHWGMVHPNFLDDKFWRGHFPKGMLATPPFDFDAMAKAWESGALTVGPKLDGREIMIAARA